MNRWARLVVCAALAGCGGDDDGDGSDAPGSDASGPSADASGGDPPVGAADIRISQRTTLDGAAIDTGLSAVWWSEPPPDPYQLVSESGPCVLTEVQPMSCKGLCEGVCIGEVCHPFPATRSAGRLTLSGGANPVDIDPVDGFYTHYQPSPLFSPGDQVEVAAAGDQVAAFEVGATAVTDLVAPGIDQLDLAPGEDFTVSWQPADPDSWIRLRLDSDQHGQFSPTVIECVVADAAGSITVPGSMIESFWATPGQCGECPVQSLIRFRRGSATAGGQPVVLEVASTVSFYPYP